MTEPVPLTPEQKRACQILESNLHRWKELPYPKFLTRKMFDTNFMAFSLEPFTKTNLPSEPTWIWNQSSGKVSVQFETTHPVSATIQKMNPRKRKGCLNAPSYKLWLYTIKQSEEPRSLYFMWCEKGLTCLKLPFSISSNPLSKPRVSSGVQQIQRTTSTTAQSTKSQQVSSAVPGTASKHSDIQSRISHPVSSYQIDTSSSSLKGSLSHHHQQHDTIPQSVADHHPHHHSITNFHPHPQNHQFVYIQTTALPPVTDPRCMNSPEYDVEFYEPETKEALPETDPTQQAPTFPALVNSSSEFNVDDLFIFSLAFMNERDSYPPLFELEMF